MQENLLKIEYKRNENGFYTVDIKNVSVVDPDGHTWRAVCRIPNCTLSADDEEGAIVWDAAVFQPSLRITEKDSTIFEITAPDEEDGSLKEVFYE